MELFSTPVTALCSGSRQVQLSNAKKNLRISILNDKCEVFADNARLRNGQLVSIPSRPDKSWRSLPILPPREIFHQQRGDIKDQKIHQRSAFRKANSSSNARRTSQQRGKQSFADTVKQWSAEIHLSSEDKHNQQQMLLERLKCLNVMSAETQDALHGRFPHWIRPSAWYRESRVRSQLFRCANIIRQKIPNPTSARCKLPRKVISPFVVLDFLLNSIKLFETRNFSKLCNLVSEFIEHPNYADAIFKRLADRGFTDKKDSPKIKHANDSAKAKQKAQIKNANTADAIPKYNMLAQQDRTEDKPKSADTAKTNPKRSLPQLQKIKTIVAMLDYILLYDGACTYTAIKVGISQYFPNVLKSSASIPKDRKYLHKLRSRALHFLANNSKVAQKCSKCPNQSIFYQLSSAPKQSELNNITKNDFTFDSFSELARYINKTCSIQKFPTDPTTKRSIGVQTTSPNEIKTLPKELISSIATDNLASKASPAHNDNKSCEISLAESCLQNDTVDLDADLQGCDQESTAVSLSCGADSPSVEGSTLVKPSLNETPNKTLAIVGEDASNRDSSPPSADSASDVNFNQRPQLAPATTYIKKHYGLVKQDNPNPDYFSEDDIMVYVETVDIPINTMIWHPQMLALAIASPSDPAAVIGQELFIKLRSAHVILAPILQNEHWMLLRINRSEEKIQLLDSLSRTGNAELNQFLGSLCETLPKILNCNTFTYENFPKILPKQSNNIDCGPYVCGFIKYLCEERALDSFDPDQVRHKVTLLQTLKALPKPPNEDQGCKFYTFILEKNYMFRCLEGECQFSLEELNKVKIHDHIRTCHNDDNDPQVRTLCKCKRFFKVHETFAHTKECTHLDTESRKILKEWNFELLPESKCRKLTCCFPRCLEQFHCVKTSTINLERHWSERHHKELTPQSNVHCFGCQETFAYKNFRSHYNQHHKLTQSASKPKLA